MMKVIQTVAGVLAVFFSIQGLANWAAKSTNEKSTQASQDKVKNQLSIERPGVGPLFAGGSPMCGIGGKGAKT